MQITNDTHAFLWESMVANNCNTYFIDGPTRILIDPGHIKHFDHVRKGLEGLGLDLKDLGIIICTHAHPDHIEAVQLFKDLPALVTLHEKEWQNLKNMENHIKAMGIDLATIAPDFLLKEGDLSINGIDLKVMHTPGHSPGEVSLYWPTRKALFTGDLIFKDGIGRTDLPGGDGPLLKESITRLADLETEWVLPGHGAIVSGENEVKMNFGRIEQYWFAYI
jgi:glyoxylase-like metal-dependent hydrolase (beta-lactamase superfamily II)